jgi:D-psicose/D-tagatose/L-ribulose 3-epimerase
VRYGVTTYLWAGDFTPAHLDILPSIKEAGFDGVELPIFRPLQFQAAAVRRGLEANGLQCVVACALVDGLSLATDDDGLRRRTITHISDVVKQAADNGARLVAGPLYSPVGYKPRRRQDAEWQRVVDGYHALASVLESHGVAIAIEPLNRFETHFLNTAADGVRLCDQIAHPNVGLLFDTFHANIEEKNIAEACRAVARHLKHVHISENDRGIPGTGHVPIADVIRVLRDIGYDGWLNIESFSFAIADLSAATSIWRDLAPTPEAIAFEGIRRLKSF